MWPLLVRQTHRAWTHKCCAVRQSLRKFAHTHCTTTADSNECSTRPLLLMFWCRFIYLTMEVNEWREKKWKQKQTNAHQTEAKSSSSQQKKRNKNSNKWWYEENNIPFEELREQREGLSEREKKSKCEFIHISHQRMNERRANRKKKWAKTHSTNKQLERTNGGESFAHKCETFTDFSTKCQWKRMKNEWMDGCDVFW